MGPISSPAGTAIDERERRRSPEEIRESIARTRADLGDTVAALAFKADVKARAADRLALVKSQGARTLRSRAAVIARRVRANPAPAAVGVVSAAALLAWRVRKR